MMKYVLLLLALWVTIAYGIIEDRNRKVAILSELNHDHGDKYREIQILPDHLKVNLKTDDGIVHLNLKRMTQIDHNRFDIRFDDSRMKREHLNLNNRILGYYQDPEKMAVITVEGKVDNSVIKRTLTGTIIYDGTFYEVQPASEQLQLFDDELRKRGLGTEHAHMLHILTEVPKELLNPDRVLAIMDYSVSRKLNPMTENGTENHMDYKKHVTKKQQGNLVTIHLELMFIIDYSVYQYYRNQYGLDGDKQMIYHYTHVLNGMYLVYGGIDESLGLRVILWLSKLHIITQPENEIVQTSNYYTVFTRLKSFLADEGYTDGFADHYMLWTKTDLRSPYGDDISGVVYKLCSKCNENESLSINEDTGYVGFITGAHELGHTLGANHDKPGHCDNTHYIMYYSNFQLNESNINTAFTFSPCSVSDMLECISGTGQYSGSGQKDCLLNPVCSHFGALKDVDILPGQIIDVDQQCKLFWKNESSTACNPLTTELCMTLKCSVFGNCTSSELRGAPGTRCNANDSNMVCYKGHCVEKDTIPSSTIDDSSCSNNNTNITNCESGKSKCPNDSSRCIINSYFCDGDEDCDATANEDGDESLMFCGFHRECVQMFGTDYVGCPNDASSCLKKSQLCDGTIQCPGKRGDEWWMYCEGSYVSCFKNYGPEYVKCPSNDSCLKKSSFCDGTDVCGDESSEFCGTSKKCVQLFGPAYVVCPSSMKYCTKRIYLCDGIEDCGDETEEFCDEWTKNTMTREEVALRMVENNFKNVAFERNKNLKNKIQKRVLLIQKQKADAAKQTRNYRYQ